VERNHFKQRIVGGLVLVALGAIVIPFLLDMHPGEEWWGKGNIPKKPDNGFVTRVLPLDEWSKQAQTDMAEGVKQMDSVPAHAPAAPAAGQSSEPSQPLPAATPSPVAPSAAQPSNSIAVPPPAHPPAAAGDGSTEGWVVQLGSFSNQKNADELREQLENKAYRVFVEKIMQDGQAVYRVRIGPQRQRADAEAIRDKMEHELQLKAMVLHFP
jgi:DedD protein